MVWKRVKTACSPKNLKQIVKNHVLDSDESNAHIVYSIMLGVFISASPFWGFQAIISLALAFAFRLNKVLAVSFTTVNVPFIPAILFGSYSIGCWILNQPIIFTIDEMNTEMLLNVLYPYLLGSVVLSTTLSLLVGFIFRTILHFTRRKKAQIL